MTSVDSSSNNSARNSPQWVQSDLAKSLHDNGESLQQGWEPASKASGNATDILRRWATTMATSPSKRVWVRTDLAKSLYSNGDSLAQGWQPQQEDNAAASELIRGWAASFASTMPELPSFNPPTGKF